MAFTYTTDWTDRYGKVTRVGGTWNSAAVTSGTISFGPINGLSIGAIVEASAFNSVTAINTWKAVVGSATTQNTIAITATSNDKGWWTAAWI